MYTDKQWHDELMTYRSSKRAVAETLEGIADHLDTPCSTGKTVTEMVRNRYTGVGPVERAAMCNRGTVGCNLFHDELTALRFTRMGLERADELIKAGK